MTLDLDRDNAAKDRSGRATLHTYVGVDADGNVPLARLQIEVTTEGVLASCAMDTRFPGTVPSPQRSRYPWVRCPASPNARPRPIPGRLDHLSYLEPALTEKARANKRIGGQRKGWSDLTKVEQLHVRSGIAKAAAVSVGNVIRTCTFWFQREASTSGKNGGSTFSSLTNTYSCTGGALP